MGWASVTEDAGTAHLVRLAGEFIPRRTLLKGGAAATAVVALSGAPARAQDPVFRHGVASGDPLPEAVVIWTRVTVAEDAAPGSGIGEPMTVRWEVAPDENFGSVVASGSVTASAETDHTVKIDVTGLEPNRWYFYRFTTRGANSPVGRTRTAPAESDHPERLRFGVVSCSHWEEGYFSAYRHLADRADLDAVVHLGDYLYEYAAVAGTPRRHEPPHEIITLADYRIRHGQYKTDPDLQRLHGSLPFICTWDDHESANNSWSGGAENHDPATEGAWSARRAASARAYLEWMPVRVSRFGAEVRLYRRLRFGTLAELSMLDLRGYRDQEVSSGPGWRAADDPARTITGRAQMQWLTAGLASSPTRWNLVGNSVMIAPLVFPPLDPAIAAAFTETMGIPRSGLPLNGDQWDGYTADRRTLFESIAGARRGDVVFLTGDIHSSWAADLPLEAAHYPAGPTVGTEFVVPSVTSAGPGELLKAPPRTAMVPVEETLKGVNRHLRYVELDSHGYGVLDVTEERARMDWFYLHDVTDPRSGVRLGASFTVASGGRITPTPPPPA